METERLTRFESLVAMADEIERLEATLEVRKEQAYLWMKAAEAWKKAAMGDPAWALEASHLFREAEELWCHG